MFALSEEPLDAERLKDRLRDVAAGACVTFEGWVRNHNEGKAVARLEYEAYAALAEKEGARILAEAVRRFGLTCAHCVHRVGPLAIGDMAVWVGVSSPHRGESFEACRFVIDEVKHRLPIWKKEYYADGDSGWVNCERCAAHGAPHGAGECTAHPHGWDLSEAAYYARQVRLSQVGPEGQERLRQARVLLVGAGGLGSPAALYLAAAGVGHLGLCEGDRLETSNLHRQILFSHADVGAPKAQLAVERLRALNPFIEAAPIPERLSTRNAEALFRAYDLVLDCTDNFATKFLINDAAVASRTPAIFSSLYQFEGQLQVVDANAGTPCLRCLWEQAPDDACVGSCADVGVLGAVAGVFGALQAMEALKHLLALPGRLNREVVLFNLLTYSLLRLKQTRNPACTCCGDRARAAVARDQADIPVEIGILDLIEGRFADYELIDIRDAADRAMRPITEFPCRHVPIDALDSAQLARATGKRLVLCCARGVRSRTLARALRARGFAEVYSLEGGVSALGAIDSVRR